MTKLLTLLVPAYNEETNLELLKQRLNPVMSEVMKLGVETEVIILDNCSTDRTRELGLSFCASDSRYRYVRYSRNFGYHASLACGFDVANGDALIILAADLQEPPEHIPRMVKLWLEGNDVVYGVLAKRNDHLLLKTLGAKIFYRLFSLLSDSEIPPFATDFRIISRRVVNAVKEMREVDRYLRGLIHWTGFKQVPFIYDRDKREHGESTAGIWVATKWALNAILCFSHKPLRAVAIFGLLAVAASILLTTYFVYIYFRPPAFMPVPPTGTTAIAVLVLFGIGVNALSLGIIGEYVGRIYNQAKLRPLYVIDEAQNIKPASMVGWPTPHSNTSPYQRNFN